MDDQWDQFDLGKMGAQSVLLTYNIASGTSITFISGTSQLGSANTTTTSSINTTGANFVVVVLASYGAVAVPTLTDSKGNTWTQIRTDVGASFSRDTIFFCFSPTVGSGHTFTSTLTGSFSSVFVGSFSGVVTSPVDQQSAFGALVAVSTIQPGSITPSSNNYLVITSNSNSSGFSSSVNLGFTLIGSQIFTGGTAFGGGLAYLIQTTATAENPTWTLGGPANAVANIVSFK